jgi:hypothetical protein
MIEKMKKPRITIFILGVYDLKCIIKILIKNLIIKLTKKSRIRMFKEINKNNKKQNNEFQFKQKMVTKESITADF